MNFRKFLILCGCAMVIAAPLAQGARADDRHDAEWRDHQRHDREWREHQWREHHYVPPPVYAVPMAGYAVVPPPIVAAPAGLNIVVPVHIR